MIIMNSYVNFVQYVSLLDIGFYDCFISHKYYNINAKVTMNNAI